MISRFPVMRISTGERIRLGLRVRCPAHLAIAGERVAWDAWIEAFEHDLVVASLRERRPARVESFW
jgi:hypothetical protein